MRKENIENQFVIHWTFKGAFMKNYFIIHGSFGNSQENWFPWLEKKLTKNGGGGN